jgi:hypothetical protein
VEDLWREGKLKRGCGIRKKAGWTLAAWTPKEGRSTTPRPGRTLGDNPRNRHDTAPQKNYGAMFTLKFLRGQEISERKHTRRRAKRENAMTFNEILLLYRKNKKIQSWENLATELGLSEAGLRHIRTGKGGLKDATVEKIMEGTGLEAPEIVAAWTAEHGRNEKVRKSWQKFQSLNLTGPPHPNQ